MHQSVALLETFSIYADHGRRHVAPAQLTADLRSHGESAGVIARALVIDDTHDVADSLGLLLQTLGAEVHVAYGGAEGLAALSTFRPNLVFLDLGMPGMDGFETARRVRATAEGKGVTLVALTGWGQQDDRSRTQAAGFDLHLTKPASVEALEDLLCGKRPASK